MLLRSDVLGQTRPRHLPVAVWDYVRGDFQWTDHEEIREVQLVRLEEFDKFGAMMRASDIGGLHYRADLHERVKELVAAS